jgi:hypothetical protein
MANIGPNKGRRLRDALSRFAAMLIEEAHDISGMTYEKLDHALEFPEGRSQEYSKYPRRRKTRAPQVDGIQRLEIRVARLLKRPAHVIVVEDRISPRDSWYPVTEIGPPNSERNLRAYSQSDLQLGYSGDWPTYRRLKYSPIANRNGVDLRAAYAWQWGILWDKGFLPDPWTREAQGIPPGVPIELVLPELVENAKHQRLMLMHMNALAAGILPEFLDEL